MRIAFAGNPNSGKTTMYNALTGRNEHVGNWAGVTVERKESPIKKSYYNGTEEIVAVDLPGAYSMSPFTSEESITSAYVKNEKPDAIINIVDATNLSRSLFFTTQLLELGIPVVVAVNMIDLVRKNGDKIDLGRLGEALGCEVVSMSALKGEGGMAAAEKAVAETFGKKPLPFYSGGSIPIISGFESILGIKSLLMGFGLAEDAIHSPNESYGLEQFDRGVETIPLFYRYFAAEK